MKILRASLMLGCALAVSRASAFPDAVVEGALQKYCADCHDAEVRKGDLDLSVIGSLGEQGELWEKIYRRLHTRQMPPPGKERPSEEEYQKLVEHLGGALDREQEAKPNPGRTDSFRRLNRTEYQNAIRDLLGVEVDAAALLPKDESSHGFDNVTVADLSPTLLNRYIAAAQKISRLAVGASMDGPGAETYRLKPDLTQEEHVPGLPLGTRGGALIEHTFPVEGEYEVQVRLMRDRNEDVEGLREAHQMELLLDGAPVRSFTIEPPKRAQDHETADRHLVARFPVKAGKHGVGVTFVKNPSSLLETKRQPYAAAYNVHRHPRRGPAVYQVSIVGPYNARPGGETESRRRIFVARPERPDQEEECARLILGQLMRRAYRRPVEKSEVERAMVFYRADAKEGGFERGIESALSAILVSPQFLFRVEMDPAGVESGTAYKVSDVELASRLSFFLWSSIPDEELLRLAERGELSRPEELERQVRRMLKDSKAGMLAKNFASQWLHLRNLESITPDLRLFPDFDDNLRQAFREEAELCFDQILREDRSIVELLRGGHSYLNERLARHYGISHVRGSRFRRVATGEGDQKRGGLLRQGGVLTVTSYATRTSPVIRGNWILANIIGTPTPPPPPNTPALEETIVSETLPMRERLVAHRANQACASCHNMMDPPGFALENFDAVGRWRKLEEGEPVDVSGGLPDGSEFAGVEGMERALLERPEIFVTTFTEKLLTYALGRGVEYYDGPAVRKIVKGAREKDYRISEIVLGVAQSQPFQMRRAL